LVELDKQPFKEFVRHRGKWAVEECYRNPGIPQPYLFHIHWIYWEYVVFFRPNSIHRGRWTESDTTTWIWKTQAWQ